MAYLGLSVVPTSSVGSEACHSIQIIPLASSHKESLLLGESLAVDFSRNRLHLLVSHLQPHAKRFGAARTQARHAPHRSLSACQSPALCLRYGTCRSGILLSVDISCAGATLTYILVATMASASAAAPVRSHMGRGKKAATAGKASKIKFVIDCQKPADDNILEPKGLVSH